jgi:hypothetical protein
MVGFALSVFPDETLRAGESENASYERVVARTH